MNEELNHQGRKENKTTSATDLRNELGEVVELKLKGSAFGITSKSWESKSAALKVSVCTRLTHHDAAVKTLFSDGDYDVLTNTFQHLRARDNERILLGLSVRPPVFESPLWSRVTVLIASDSPVAPDSSHRTTQAAVPLRAQSA